MIRALSRIALATTVGLAPLVAGTAASGTAPTTAGAESGTDLSVAELDLGGVSRQALPDLPAVPPQPSEDVEDEGVVVASGAEAATASPEPTATTSPEPTATASPEPTATTSPEPSTAPSPQVAESPAEAPAPDVLTRELDTAPFSVLGVTWDDAPDLDDVVIRYRVRQAGTWTDWEAVGASDIAPDADAREGSGSRRGATDPIVAIDADGVQIWAESATGTVTGLKAVLVDPGTRPEDAQLPTGPPGTATSGASVPGAAAAGGTLSAAADPAVTATVAPGMPTIIRRSEWGADESLRTCEPEQSTSMVSAAVHHTASANGYSAAEVPGLLRGFMAYHTRPEALGGRGWCDIGYNFLVDAYGRVFEGRAGSIDKSVVGVHTGGFNSRTIGVAAIGNFSTAAPTASMLEGISRVIAWKFTQHRIFAGTTVAMVSGGGASKYPAGTVVQFPTIYGHRDAQLTSCPGELLYSSLGQIRARVAQLANATVQATPFGAWEGQTVGRSSITVRGWFIDPDTPDPITVAITVDGRFTTARADLPREDVATNHPGYGPAHGYSVEVPVTNGLHAVCVSALNVGDGENRLLGCKWITASNPPPVGNVELATSTADSITVSGWALDPDTTDPIAVRVSVDGAATTVRADVPRPDLARYFSSTDHGFVATVPATAGRHVVCVSGVNVPSGTNPSLGCRTVTVVNAPPLGNVEAVKVEGRTVTVSGWALDPDSTASIPVHVYVDNGAKAATADLPRPDLARFFPSTEHGFTVTVPAMPGSRKVCVYGINTPVGSNPALACRTVTIANAAPVGMIDGVRVADGRLRVSGWALDPDVTTPINVALYVNGRGYFNRADGERADIAAAFPGYGSAHGYSLSVPAAPGRYEVCAVAVNDVAGTNTSLGCRVVTG